MPIDLADPTFRGLLAAARGGGPCRRCKGRRMVGSDDPDWPGPDPELGPLPVECPRCSGSGRAGPDPAAARALADWLPEQGATAADVLRLFARPPPPPASGPGTTVRHLPDDDDSLLPVLAAWAEGHAPPGRAEAVRELDAVNLGLAWGLVRRGPPPALALTEMGRHPDEPTARRALKRVALGLWDGEVEVPCPACRGPVRKVEATRRAHGPCRVCLSRGAVKPSALIPPEPGDTE